MFQSFYKPFFKSFSSFFLRKAQVHIDQGFDFLGQNVRKYNGKFLPKPSKTSLQNVANSVKKMPKPYFLSTEKYGSLKYVNAK